MIHCRIGCEGRGLHRFVVFERSIDDRGSTSSLSSRARVIRVGLLPAGCQGVI